jgi:hypothetical protein
LGAIALLNVPDELAALLVDQADGEELVVDHATEQRRDVVEQAVGVEDRGDLAPDL